MTPRAVRTLALVAAAAVLTLPSCGSDDGSPASSPTASCDQRLGSPAPKAAPPKALPTPKGAVFDSRTDATETRSYNGYVAGDDALTMRDQLRDAFEAADYKVDAVDVRSEGRVGTFHFSGEGDGILLVAVLCPHQLRLSYLVPR